MAEGVTFLNNFPVHPKRSHGRHGNFFLVFIDHSTKNIILDSLKRVRNARKSRDKIYVNKRKGTITATELAEFLKIDRKTIVKYATM